MKKTHIIGGRKKNCITIFESIYHLR